MESPEEKESANRAVFMERGPGLDHRYRTWVGGKTADGKYTLTSGLGGMGCGSMWHTTSEEEKTAPEWINAPIIAIHPDDEARLR